mgnify:CR=1 FL=1
MVKQVVNLGTTPDDGTGDNLRDGMDKVNDNFDEIYTKLGDGTGLSSGIEATATVITLSAPTINGVVGGTQTSTTITTLTSTTVLPGTMTLASGSVTDSSGAITFGDENLSSTGTLSIGQITTNQEFIINTGITSGHVRIATVEGTADDHELTIDVRDPTADRTITFPDVTGSIITTGDSRTVTGAMIALDTVSEINMANDAISSVELKDVVTLLIKNSGGTTLKTIYGAGS